MAQKETKEEKELKQRLFEIESNSKIDNWFKWHRLLLESIDLSYDQQFEYFKEGLTPAKAAKKHLEQLKNR